jgi:autotransporter family porin
LLIGTALLITSAVITIVHFSSPSPPAPVYFHTLPPGARLPFGAECARLVRASPSSESRPVNTRFNHTVGQQVAPAFFPAGDSPQVKKLAPRISGEFTGTTQEILRWAACKWGIDQDVVFAQAAVESWWRQDQFGDWAADPKLCPPGHGIGADGKPGQCPQSYGILQNRYPFEEAAWPGIGASTAMNADAAYAIWRSCYDGYEIWLNNQPRSRPYHAGDLWGCVGRWFAGSWYTAVAERYIRSVKKYLDARIWLQPSFTPGG